MTSDMWHVTCDISHFTCEMWHVTSKTFLPIMLHIGLQKQVLKSAINLLRHTPRYSIRSGPICPYFQMTTFKAKNVFLVFGMGHTMNKLTNEYKKMQNFKNLVDLQCKCVKLDTPRIGPILGFPPSKKSKSTLNFLSIWKSSHASLKNHIFSFACEDFEIRKFLGVHFDFFTAPIFGDETWFSSSDQHFQYIEAVKPQVSYMFGKGFYPTLWWANLENILKFILLSYSIFCGTDLDFAYCSGKQ